MKRVMKPRKTSVTVEIAGEKHVLRSDAPAEYTRSVAAHVDGTIRSLGVVDTLELHRTAILAAMLITDELFRTREELRTLREEVEQRSALLADRLERAVSPRTPSPKGDGASP